MINLQHRSLSRRNAIILLLIIGLAIGGGVIFFTKQRNSAGTNFKVPSLQESAKAARLPFTPEELTTPQGKAKAKEFLKTTWVAYEKASDENLNGIRAEFGIQ